MSSQLTQAIKLIAVTVHGIKGAIGVTSELSTQAKTLVGAINELSLQSSNLNTEQVTRLIESKLAELTNGASDAYDTLKEIEDAITAGGTTTQQLLTTTGENKRKVKALEDYVGVEDNILTIVQTALQTGV